MRPKASIADVTVVLAQSSTKCCVCLEVHHHGAVMPISNKQVGRDFFVFVFYLVKLCVIFWKLKYKCILKQLNEKRFP